MAEKEKQKKDHDDHHDHKHGHNHQHFTPDSVKTHIHKHICEYDCGHSEPEKQSGSGQKRFIIAIIVTLITMILEIGGGIITNSLALISDGGHMFTHLFALLISFIAIIFAAKPADAKNTYGYFRLEILAALVNGITLILITIWISYEAYLKLFTPEPIETMEMMVIAVVGLIVNILTAFLLMKSAKESINVKSAFIHLIGDTLSSVAIIIGGIVIHYTGWLIIDPILSFIICISILGWSYRLIMESVDILLEGIPKDIAVGTINRTIEKIDGISGIHDLHIWTLSTNIYSLTAHIELDCDMQIKDSAEILKKINTTLCHDHKIGHTVIQFEPYPPDENGSLCDTAETCRHSG